ncbi:MAG: peptide deformylase [Saprospiraceae bacterium]|nr:peptide deformylase [Saprospiraceae bacterium]
MGSEISLGNFLLFVRPEHIQTEGRGKGRNAFETRQLSLGYDVFKNLVAFLPRSFCFCCRPVVLQSLSVSGFFGYIRGDVERPPVIRVRYQDENFQEFEETFSGINARVIQHEYDHIEGVLFVEHLKPLKKRLIQRKLENIRVGKVNTDYKMRFASVR